MICYSSHKIILVQKCIQDITMPSVRNSLRIDWDWGIALKKWIDRMGVRCGTCRRVRRASLPSTTSSWAATAWHRPVPMPLSLSASAATTTRTTSKCGTFDRAPQVGPNSHFSLAISRRHSWKTSYLFLCKTQVVVVSAEFYWNLYALNSWYRIFMNAE